MGLVERNILIANPRDVKRVQMILRKERFNGIAGVNTLFNGLLENKEFCARDFSDLRMVIAGGMAFHGGLIGVMLAVWWFGKRNGKSFFQIMDFIAPVVPIGLGAGRIGNFINAELWGKASDVPWAMIFPTDPQQLARHPSQLYQFALEGVALFLILWLYSRKPRPTMAVSGMFALFYGIFRFIVEFVRVPDAQLGYLAFGWVTMGQILCIPMIAGGLFLIWWAYHRDPAANKAAL